MGVAIQITQMGVALIARSYSLSPTAASRHRTRGPAGTREFGRVQWKGLRYGPAVLRYRSQDKRQNDPRVSCSKPTSTIAGKEADQSNRFVCIAGYLSFVSCWEEFNRKWACLLQEHKLPELHMKHWKSIARQNGWTNHHASAVLNDFVDVIRESDVWVLALALMCNSGGRYPERGVLSLAPRKSSLCSAPFE